MMKITIFTLLLLMISCSFKPKFNKDYKRTDLVPTIADSAEYYTNAVYKMPKEYTNDLIISLVRVNATEVETSKEPIYILMNLLAAKNQTSVDTSLIHSKLTIKEWEKFTKSFPDALVKSHSVTDEIGKHPALAHKLTCEPGIIDAHWAQFSVTGDLSIIEKMLVSYKVVETPCYFSSLEWSIAAQAKQNKDVYDYLIQLQSKRSPQNKKMVKSFYP